MFSARGLDGLKVATKPVESSETVPVTAGANLKVPVLIVAAFIALLNVAVTMAPWQMPVAPPTGTTETTVGGLKGDVAPPALSPSLHPAIVAITAVNRNAGIQNFLKFELRISFSSLHTCKAIRRAAKGNMRTYECVVCASLHTAGKNHRISECALLYSSGAVFLLRWMRARSDHARAALAKLSMKPKKNSRNGTAGRFDPQVFLDTAGVARKVAEFRRGESVYSQGEAADTVMYVQKGGVKFSVVNASGKEAVVAMFGPSDFFGEGCMAGQTIRMGTARAMTPTTLLVMEKNELLRVLHAEHELSDHFIRYMLAHNIQVEEDLIDQLFNSSEKRLARTLLLLARYGKQDQPIRILPKVSQETLASMIGTTRSRVNFFMNKFRKLGFIEYNGKIKINKSLLTVVLHE